MIFRPKNQQLLAVILFAILIAGIWVFASFRQKDAFLRSVPDHSVVKWELGGQSLTVEVVRTPESITQGLGGRETLAADGMLFLLPRRDQPVFWMKDMRFPIDIIWIDDGRIVGIERNVQPPMLGAPDSQLQRVIAPQEVNMVLETLPGRVEW